MTTEQLLSIGEQARETVPQICIRGLSFANEGMAEQLKSRGTLVDIFQ